MKLRGVNLHHDLGALGAAVHRAAIRRQLRILREMGCNAVRTSHNPPARELLDLCDESGILVIVEAFDTWRKSKLVNDYGRHFDTWAECDIAAMVRRHRNHPCVIMWSIGNEVPDQHTPAGGEIARMLAAACRREDPTRPVTLGCDNVEHSLENGLVGAVDAVGWNYKASQYQRLRAAHPGIVQYASESASCIGTRGEYTFPAVRLTRPRQANLQVPAWDLAAPAWGYPPDVEFAAQEDQPGLLGEFVWSGFDYLGEPTPYIAEWPSRSSYFGICDLAGFPKDRYHLYQARWSRRDVLHLMPHWTWPGMEGTPMTVQVYTTFPAVELFLNGRFLGTRSPDASDVMTRYRLRWDDVPYQPGELRAIAFDMDGQAMQETVHRTAGPPATLRLEPDRPSFVADGNDLLYVTVSVLDEEGTLCPHADDLVRFSVQGPADIVGVDNGDPTSVESFQAPQRHDFHGLCLVILRSRNVPGAITLDAHAEGLVSARLHTHAAQL